MNNKYFKWRTYFGTGAVISIIDFIIMVNQKSGSTGAKITGLILLAGIVFCILCVVKINVYNAQAKNMSADEYISDRFANAIPKDNSVTVKCPYCQSTNTKKISNVSKAGSVAVFGVLAAGKVVKEWHCNDCKSDF